MTIALILDPYGEQRPSGLGRAALQLTRAIIGAMPEHHFVIVLKRAPQVSLSLPGSNWEVRAPSGGLLWLDEAVRMTGDADTHVFFTPVFPLFVRPKRSVVVVHDFAYLTFPNGMVRDAVLKVLQRRALRRASIVVAVSQATRAEAAEFSGRAPGDIAVIYNGVNDLCASSPAQTPPRGDYFLLGGGIKERKNTLFGIEAYAAFVAAGGAQELWILGKPKDAYGQRVQARAHELGVGSRVRFLGYVDDAQLSSLYRGACAFIFPSVVEGFGMMPFEAISCGAAVVYAGTPVLREVIGDGGIAVDPHDAASFGAALGALAGNPELRARTAARGRERAARYSWDTAGAEFAGLLEVG